MTPEAAAAILNVGLHASPDEVTRAFKLRARMTHPDRFAGAPKGEIDAATAEFVRVTAARDALLEAAAKRERSGTPRSGQPAGSSPEGGKRHRTQAADPPMTFDEFVTQREQAGWRWTPRTASPPQHPEPRPNPRADRPGPPTGPTPVARPPRSEKGLWWGVGSFVAVLILLAFVLATNALQSALQDQSQAKDSLVPASRLDAGNGATVAVDGSADGWTWTLTSDTDCPNARLTVHFSDNADGDALFGYADIAALKAGVPHTYTVPSSASDQQWASLDSVTCQ